jgi:CysZ protein
MIKNILKAIRAYAGAFALIGQLGLWKYFGVPMLISFLTAVFIGLTAWGLSDTIGAVISKLWLWEWGSETFSTLSDVFGGIIVLAFGLIIYKHIIMALSAPFMSPVSEKIELHLLGKTHSHRNTNGLSQLWRGIRINIRNLMMELLFSVPILIISLIPLVNIFSSILLFLVQSYYAGFGNMDYTLERHFEVKESVVFVKKNRGLAIGNGMVFMAMLLIPVVGIILVLPISVTASTTETVMQIEKARKIKESKLDLEKTQSRK